MRLFLLFIFIYTASALSVQKSPPAPSPEISDRAPSSAAQSAKKPYSKKTPHSSKSPPGEAPSKRQLSQSQDLHTLIDSLSEKLNRLPQICQMDASFQEKAKTFQTELILINQLAGYIKQNFYVEDPSESWFIDSVHFYLNRPSKFEYEQKLSANLEQLRSQIRGLKISFETMYRVGFNISEDVSVENFSPGWPRSIGTSLLCLSNL